MSANGRPRGVGAGRESLLALTVLAITLSGSCESNQEPPAPAPPPPERSTHAFIRGLVVDESNQAVSDVPLTITVLVPTDTGPERVGECFGFLATGVVVTASDEDGAFENRILAAGMPFEILSCVALLAEPGESSGLSDVLVSGLELQFVNVAKPPDTLQVEVMLPAN